MITDALDIANATTPERAQADRLRVDTIKWAAGKKYARVYGDKGSGVTVNTMTNVSVGHLGEAIKTAVSRRRQPRVVDVDIDGCVTPKPVIDAEE